jgi:hypothetical protein
VTTSTLEEVAALKAGSVLMDRGEPVTIDRIVDLGSVNFGSETLELWDPVRLNPSGPQARVPGVKARVFAALEGTWARALKLKFSAAKVVRWQTAWSHSSGYGTLALSKRGWSAKLADTSFESSFWDEVIDAEFDTRDGATIIDLKVGRFSGPLLVWNDQQMGGTLFRGVDAKGRLAQVLFDGVRLGLKSYD